MSYSFSVKAGTKAEMAALISAEFDKVLETQPIHVVDRQAAQEAAKAFLAVVKEPAEGESVAVSVSGSVQWRDANSLAPGSQTFIGAGVSVNAYISEN